ncbi:unnamed protein product [Trichobilharzia regenti]|nr:unnamed protein product [Trichobilharzia regenti]
MYENHIILAITFAFFNNVRRTQLLNEANVRSYLKLDKIGCVILSKILPCLDEADSIITQDVEEGILVRILCNVSGDDKPDGAGPFRYEWRNPNGTLVGTQWKLELGQIKMHESGIYVCRVSYEYNERQMSTSAGVIFPGIRGNVLEVRETGDILQECQVISAKPAQYTFQWFGPDGRLVSNSALLQRDYVTRPRDEGIYRCVATPVEEGRLQVENHLIVTLIRKMT